MPYRNFTPYTYPYSERIAMNMIRMDRYCAGLLPFTSRSIQYRADPMQQKHSAEFGDMVYRMLRASSLIWPGKRRVSSTKSNSNSTATSLPRPIAATVNAAMRALRKRFPEAVPSRWIHNDPAQTIKQMAESGLMATASGRRLMKNQLPVIHPTSASMPMIHAETVRYLDNRIRCGVAGDEYVVFISTWPVV